MGEREHHRVVAFEMIQIQREQKYKKSDDFVATATVRLDVVAVALAAASLVHAWLKA